MDLAYDTTQQINDHFLRCYPNEGCGLVVMGEFVPCDNTHEEPRSNFRIAPEHYVKHKKGIQAVVHSHTRTLLDELWLDPRAPSKNDMIGQEQTKLPWGIAACEGETVTPLLWFGETRPTTFNDLLGRRFVWGIQDCYSLIRDYYLVCHGLELRDYPRDPAWWRFGDNLYLDYYAAEGFHEVPIEKILPGDAVLMQIRSPVPNHAAIYLGDDVLLHHLQERLSARDTLSRWLGFVTHTLRYREPLGLVQVGDERRHLLVGHQIAGI